MNLLTLEIKHTFCAIGGKSQKTAFLITGAAVAVGLRVCECEEGVDSEKNGFLIFSVKSVEIRYKIRR